MSPSGTRSYAGRADLPALVVRAVALAERMDFPLSCRPEQGRLLFALAAGARRMIGETGTGCGVGLAWLASGAPPGVRIVSVDRDAERARLAAELFVDLPHVQVLTGDWTRIGEHAPFDLLVFDGGGHGKRGGPADPEALLAPAGTVVIDDFAPMAQWPPVHAGSVDAARMYWLDHPALISTEVRLAPDLATVIGTRRP